MVKIKLKAKPVNIRFILLKWPIEKAKELSALPVKKQNIILKEYIDTGFEKDDKQISQYLYLFRKVPISKIPRSLFEKNPDYLTQSDIRRLKQLKKHILNPNIPPIVLSAYHIDKKGVYYTVLEEGNHRVQALREVIAEGKVPSNYRLKAIIRIAKDPNDRDISFYDSEVR